MTKKIPLVVVAGATASGKTSLSIALAEEFGGEVVSCDSMQIYKNLDIGTAKPTKEEMGAIPHHMLDIAEPWEEFSVERYCTMAHEVIKEIHKRNKLPILAGGTGLYRDNTIYATCFSAPRRNEELSYELLRYAEENGNEALFEILKEEDGEAAEKLHPNDVKRVIRAIETRRTTGMVRSEIDAQSRPEESPYDYLYLAIDMPRDILYERIEKRVDIMLEDGLLEEVKKHILPDLEKLTTSSMAIGYREVVWYFKGLCTYDEMVLLLKRNTRRYAKRQLTWLRNNEDVIWIDYKNFLPEAGRLINERWCTL